MKKHSIRTSLILLILCLGTYIWIDPGHPTDSAAKSVIQRLGLDEMTVNSVSVGRSFVGRRVNDPQSVRVWPVRAMIPSSPEAKSGSPSERAFYVWKNSAGQWQAEADNLLAQQWKSRGYFGILGR